MPAESPAADMRGAPQRRPSCFLEPLRPLEASQPRALPDRRGVDDPSRTPERAPLLLVARSSSAAGSTSSSGGATSSTSGTVGSSTASTAAPVSARVSITSATALTTSSSRRFITRTPWAGRPCFEMPLDAGALDHAVLGDEDEVLVLAHDQRAGHAALLLGEADRLDAHRAAALDRVLLDRRALAVAVLGDHQQLGVRPHHVHGQHAVVAARRRSCRARRRCRGPSARAWSSLKRAAWPERETMMMSSSPLVRRTATSSSSSRILIAMIPSALIGVL